MLPTWPREAIQEIVIIQRKLGGKKRKKKEKKRKRKKKCLPFKKQTQNCMSNDFSILLALEFVPSVSLIDSYDICVVEAHGQILHVLCNIR